MSKTPDPFALTRKMMAAQKAQLDLAATMLKSARETAAFQQRTLKTAEAAAKAQRQWLALWGIK